MQRDADQEFTTEETGFREEEGADAGYGTALDSLDLGAGGERVSPAAPAPASRTPALMAEAAADPSRPAAARMAHHDVPVRHRGLLGRLFGWLLGAR